MYSMFWDFLEDKNKRPTSTRERNSKVRAMPGNLHWARSHTSPGVNVDPLPPHVEEKQGRQEKLGGGVGPGWPSAGEKVRVSSSVSFQIRAHCLPLTSFGWQRACSVCAGFLCVVAEPMCDVLVWLHGDGDGHQRAWAVLPSHKAPTLTNPN